MQEVLGSIPGAALLTRGQSPGPGLAADHGSSGRSNAPSRKEREPAHIEMHGWISRRGDRHGMRQPSPRLRPLLRIQSDILQTPRSVDKTMAAEAAHALKICCSIVVSVSACHAEDPDSIPGGGVFFRAALPHCAHGCSLTWRMPQHAPLLVDTLHF